MRSKVIFFRRSKKDHEIKRTIMRSKKWSWDRKNDHEIERTIMRSKVSIIFDSFDQEIKIDKLGVSTVEINFWNLSRISLLLMQDYFYIHRQTNKFGLLGRQNFEMCRCQYRWVLAAGESHCKLSRNPSRPEIFG